ncbi:hypothetical protein ACFL35_19610, partial [Candidatus Riflebacteria bacterium]
KIVRKVQITQPLSGQSTSGSNTMGVQVPSTTFFDRKNPSAASGGFFICSRIHIKATVPLPFPLPFFFL